MKNLFLITLMLSLSLTGFTQVKQWEKAQKKNTIENYQKFLLKYPDSEYSDDAKQKIIEIEFNNAKLSNTVTGYKYFLDTYKTNKYSDEAAKSLIKLEFEQAKSKNTISGYKYFLDAYGDNDYSSQAESKLIDLEFELANSKNTIEGYKYFLETYNDSSLSLNAKEELIELEYELAKTKNTVEAYEYFIDSYPNNKYLDELGDIISGNEFKKTKEKNSKEAYDKYLVQYPNSKYSILAKAELATIECESIDKSNQKEVNSLILQLENLGTELDTLTSKLQDDKEIAACYAKAAELYELSGDLKKSRKEAFIEPYKKSGYYYNRSAFFCMRCEFRAMSNAMNSWISGLDKGGSKSVQTLQYSMALAMAEDDLKKNIMYNKSVDVFRKAGLNKQADWLLDSGQIKRFEYDEIIAE